MALVAFSSNRQYATCVDCKAAGTHLLRYYRYTVGDIVCNTHRIIRGKALGRRIEDALALAYSERDMRLVGPETI